MNYKSILNKTLVQVARDKAQENLSKYQDEKKWEHIGYILDCKRSYIPKIYKNKINGKFYVDKSKEIDLPKYNGEKNITVNKCDCGQCTFLSPTKTNRLNIYTDNQNQIVAYNNYRQDIYFSNK